MVVKMIILRHLLFLILSNISNLNIEHQKVIFANELNKIMGLLSNNTNTKEEY